MMERSVISRLDAKLKAEREVERKTGNSPEIERLLAATLQSNAELMRSQKQIMDQLLELKAGKDAPVSTPEWEFQIQRDGANHMTRVIAKPMAKKEGA